MNDVTDASAETPTLTPDALVSMIGTPAGAVTIKGRVSELDEHASGLYGRLALEKASVRFRVGLGTLLQNGDHVLIRGYLKLLDADPRFLTRQEARATHERRITGSLVGHWIPVIKKSPLVERAAAWTRESSRMPLEQFVAERGLDALLILATGFGKADVSAAAKKHGIQVQIQVANLDDPDRFVQQLRQQDWSKFRGVALARGGAGEGLRAFGSTREVFDALMQLDVPFYCALGHTGQNTPLDSVADEAFDTPTALGFELGRIGTLAATAAAAAPSAANSTRKFKGFWWLVLLVIGVAAAIVGRSP